MSFRLLTLFASSFATGLSGDKMWEKKVKSWREGKNSPLPGLYEMSREICNLTDKLDRQMLAQKQVFLSNNKSAIDPVCQWRHWRGPSSPMSVKASALSHRHCIYLKCMSSPRHWRTSSGWKCSSAADFDGHLLLYNVHVRPKLFPTSQLRGR